MKLHFEPNLDVQTADFTYIRWIGDGKGIEKQTKTWDKVIISRERETQTWVRYVRHLFHRGEIVYAYYDNQYSGSASVVLFRESWETLA